MEPENPTMSVVYGEKLPKIPRRKRQKIFLTEMFFDFTKNTTLHGLRYTSERGLSILEKIFWLITFVISCGLCFYLINNVYIKWQTSPVIVSISEHLVPVNMVPFPSVTICPQMKCKSSVYNYTGELARYVADQRMENKSMTVEEVQKVESVMLVCKGRALSALRYAYNLNATAIDTFKQIAPNYKDLFTWCSWRNIIVECSSLFRKVITREGICFNMNSLPAEDIFNKENIQQDYPYLKSARTTKGFDYGNGHYDENVHNPYPRRGRENGATPDLQVVLTENIGENDEVCNGNNRGYKIYIQHPADLPQSSLYYYAALHNQTSSLALKFNMINTSETLRSYSPEERQCYFPGEKSLKYFKVYTANNCRIECQSNFTFKSCGCVMFHMPHSDSRSICDITVLDCALHFQEKIAGAKYCQCLPACLSVQYDAEVLMTEYTLQRRIKTLGNYNISQKYKRHEGQMLSKIQLYFKEPHFLSMRRSELFGTTDFLANCGGLLGLFLGFSVLSLVEIFYFLTLRLCCTLKRDLREEKSLKSKRDQIRSDLTDQKNEGKNIFCVKHE